MARATHDPEMTALLARRGAEMAAVFMIGDGLLGLVQPKRHVDLWQENAMGAEKLVAPFKGHPKRRRVYGALQILAGLALAAALTRDTPQRD